MVIPLRRDVRTIALLLALIVGTQIAIALPRQFFAHYYQLWLVPLCIGAGLGVSMLSDLRARRLAPVAACVVLALLAFHQFPSYLLPPDEWAHRKHGPFLAKWLPPVAREIDQMLGPNATFYQWADEPWLYLATRRRPPAAAIWRMHTVEGPVAPWLTQRTLEDLRADPPKLIVIWDGNLSDETHPIARFILDHYSPVSNPTHRYPLVLFERRDGGTTLPQR
jgi:hypothetical protein